MRIAYFDCFAGIAGDMVLGAMVSAGVNVDELCAELDKLNLDGWKIETEYIIKHGITGTKALVIAEEQKAHRHLRHIVEIIDNSSLSDKIKDKSKKIFTRLAEAEAKVHNTTPEKIHFHEVGAVDAIIDIVGSVICFEILGIEKIYSSKIHVGTGFVECQHGRIPLPSPATAELLAGKPIYSTGIESELTTPTGAAIISTLTESFGAMPEMKVGNIGYGAGTRDLPIPNMLRVFIGETEAGKFEADMITRIETNIDDMIPEFFDYLFEEMFSAGALDMFLTPVIMKKSRPGTMVTILSPNNKVDELLAILFRETTTFGVRIQQVARKKLKREFKTVETKYGTIKVKVGYINEHTKCVPEYEECKAAAIKHGVSIREVYNEALKFSE